MWSDKAMKSSAKQIIEEAYGLVEEPDELITITEQGLIKAIDKAIQAAKAEAWDRAIDVLSKADPLEANSHAWEDGPDDLLAIDVQKYLVKVVATALKREKACDCFCHTKGFAGDISQHHCCQRGTP
jgi:hypothetical protein